MAFTLVSDSMLVSGDTSISKPAVVLKGGDTDDGISMHTTAAAAVSANHTAGTIMAWVMPGDITSTMSIVSFNDTDVVEYIDFKIVAGKLVCSCTDATTAQFVLTTDAVVIPKHVWTHVAVVQDGTAAKLYVNGRAPAQTFTTSTDVAEWFVNLDGIDKGWIGVSSIGGAGATTEEFVGAIADVKWYATAHTADEVYQDYLGNPKASPYAAFKLDGDLVNYGSEGTAGTLVSDAYLTPTYNEFISRIRWAITAQGTIVTGDCVGMSDVGGRGTALFINVA